MDGYNATIFTYGQTGSGKTHSILGNEADPGFIPRCIEDVFAYKENHSAELEFTLRISYLEVSFFPAGLFLGEGSAWAAVEVAGAFFVLASALAFSLACFLFFSFNLAVALACRVC